MPVSIHAPSDSIRSGFHQPKGVFALKLENPCILHPFLCDDSAQTGANDEKHNLVAVRMGINSILVNMHVLESPSKSSIFTIGD